MGQKLEPAEAFGQILRELRLDKGLTQEELGFEAGIRRTYVSILELGQQQPSLTTILKLASALRISAAKFIELVELRVAQEVGG